MKYSIGIDSGSVATKGVLFDGEQIIHQLIIPTGWSPKSSAEEMVQRLMAGKGVQSADVVVVATGYGRKSLALADKDVTEITCHAKGAHFLNPAVRTIIDIGGQDSKAITVDEQGNVLDFVMNDKCAAGTGRFLEVMINSLGEDIGDLDQLTQDAEPELINSMCTVFAESEVVSLLAKGATKEAIALGIIHSIATRTNALVGKLKIANQVLFTGGLANSRRIQLEISKKLGREVVTSPYSQIAGALGAAVIGWGLFDKLISKREVVKK